MDGLPLNALSGGRLEFAGQSPQQSRLARAVDTDQAYTLTWSETPGQILDELHGRPESPDARLRVR